MATILVPADLHSPCHVLVKCQEVVLPGLNCFAALSIPEAWPSFSGPGGLGIMLLLLVY